MSERRPELGLFSAIVILVIVLGLWLAIGLPAEHACKRRGGIYLWREGQCVAAPSPMAPR